MAATSIAPAVPKKIAASGNKSLRPNFPNRLRLKANPRYRRVIAHPVLDWVMRMISRHITT